MKDPIVDEVREARKKHAQRFNFDLHGICVDLKKKEKEYSQKYGHPIKSLPYKDRSNGSQQCVHLTRSCGVFQS